MTPELWHSIQKGFQKAMQRAVQTGEDPADLLFTIAQDKTETLSIKEHNTSGEVMKFVCVPITTPAAIPSTKMTCDLCHQQVWMSPATKLTYDQITTKQIVCIDCLKPSLG